MDTFLALFRLSRPEKATFMTSRMADFFHALAETLAELKMLKLFFPRHRWRHRLPQHSALITIRPYISTIADMIRVSGR